MIEPRISYGCIRIDGVKSEDRIHHIFDYGQTGLGMGPVGHSQHSICGKYKSEYFHVYMQAVPIWMAKGLILTSGNKDICPVCKARFKNYIIEHDIKSPPGFEIADELPLDDDDDGTV